MQRKKILWLCSWYPSKGDSFNGDFIQRHARAASLFNEITVIHVYADTSMKKGPVSVEVNHSGSLTENVLRFPKSISFFGRLRAYLQLRSFYKKAILEYLRANGKPDVVHVHVPIWAGESALWLRKKFGIPFIVTEHWGLYNEIEKNNFKTKSFWFRRKTKTIFSRASAFLSVSHFLAGGINRMVCRMDYDIVPNVVDTSLFFPVNRLSGKFRFIHVSNMVPIKNPEALLKTFNKVNAGRNDVELVMVGPVPENVKQLWSTLQAKKNIFFRGEVNYEQVAKEMQNSDCFLLFSKMENSPCVIGEALCCGIPVIASAVGGVPELLEESNSILVPAFDENALLSAMNKMIETRRTYDSGSIASKAKEKFSYRAAGQIMNETYRRVID